MRITRMQVNHVSQPLGFDLGERPTFSWVVEGSEGTRAEASRVVVMLRRHIVADTGWADLDAKACAIDMRLLPRTRYEWSVAVRTDAGEQINGDLDWFATGTYEVAYETTEPLRRVPNVDWTLAQILDNPDVSAVVRGFVDGFDYSAMTADPAKTLRELQAAGFGQNVRLTPEQLEACDAALRELAE